MKVEGTSSQEKNAKISFVWLTGWLIVYHLVDSVSRVDGLFCR